jgi:anhydro-N-acetylmuramic acid kinase
VTLIKEQNTKKPSRIIGIMSGTSHDGADFVLAETGFIKNSSNPFQAKLLAHLHQPYGTSMKEQIRRSFFGDAELICGLNFALGEFYARGVIKLLQRTGIPYKTIDAIASHGQTIYHVPPGNKKRGSTLQIGEASVIAERTGIATISDFRTRDMAAGGQGAPLVPITDYLLFNKKGVARAIVNIGGMANVTIIQGKQEDTIAFDMGPGNALIDEAMRIVSRYIKSYDRNGAFARSGKCHRHLRKKLSSHPYLKKRPPKSTGRETFGEAMVRHIFSTYRKAPHEDIVATLTHFTSESIHRAIIPYRPDEVILSGGGTKNSFLMSLLHDRFQESSIPVHTISEYGIPSEAKEALSFAILGYLTLKGMPGNIPSATGAERAVVLGKITLP